MECPVCKLESASIGFVDSNKACREPLLTGFKDTGVLLEYFQCNSCKFAFCPEMMTWDTDRFNNEVYNQDYERVDPEYKFIRPERMARIILGNIKEYKPRHLDYGSGSGELVRLLNGSGWTSENYEPMQNHSFPYGSFELITVFEVFEHVSDPHKLFRDLDTLASKESVIIFSTAVSDQTESFPLDLSWWYLAPRNGHISLYSRRSLRFLASGYDFRLKEISSGSHTLIRGNPKWIKT